VAERRVLQAAEPLVKELVALAVYNVAEQLGPLALMQRQAIALNQVSDGPSWPGQ